MLKFIYLERKSLLRSLNWKKQLFFQILKTFAAFIFVFYFIVIGLTLFYILKDAFPKKSPFQIINFYVLFYLFGNLIIRYLMQKTPFINIKPLLILPIKKNKVIHFLLLKSEFSIYNFLELCLFIPLSIVFVVNGYNATGIVAWFFTLFFISQSLHYTVFLINKSNKSLAIIVFFVGISYCLQHYNILEFNLYFKDTLGFIYKNPILGFLFILLPLFMYFLNFKFLKNRFFLDELNNKSAEKIHLKNLAFLNKFGKLSTFLKNDIRLILRNKRAKSSSIFALFSLFYGLIFNDYFYSSKFIFFFSYLIITGGFIINYGQFIPAWDSQNYKMFMCQSFTIKSYLNSKWLLMSSVTLVLYILSFFYLIFSVKTFVYVSLISIYNIGFQTLFILFIGSYSRKAIDLNQGSFGNTQGTSFKHFFIGILYMLIPLLIMWLSHLFFEEYIGPIILAIIGVLGLLFKNYILNIIANKYKREKYNIIKAYEE